MENHNYFVVITAQILLDTNLSDKQKLLIGLITNLSNLKGYCFASNKYLSECLKCSENTIRQNISFLEENNYIGRVIKLDDKGSVEFRSLTILNPPSENRPTPPQNQTDPPSENRPTPGSKNRHIITDSINNKIINITFSDFWDLYDKKVEFEKSQKIWLKLSDTDRKLIMDYIPKYKIHTPDKKYRKNPTTFLNNKSWNDELIPLGGFSSVRDVYVPSDHTKYEQTRQPIYNPQD